MIMALFKDKERKKDGEVCCVSPGKFMCSCDLLVPELFLDTHSFAKDETLNEEVLDKPQNKRHYQYQYKLSLTLPNYVFN